MQRENKSVTSTTRKLVDLAHRLKSTGYAVLSAETSVVFAKTTVLSVKTSVVSGLYINQLVERTCRRPRCRHYTSAALIDKGRTNSL